MYYEPKRSWKTEETGLIVMNEVHPNEEQLERYAMGRLAERELAPIEEHLLVCEACQERLEMAESLLPAMRRALREVERQCLTIRREHCQASRERIVRGEERDRQPQPQRDQRWHQPRAEGAAGSGRGTRRIHRSAVSG